MSSLLGFLGPIQWVVWLVPIILLLAMYKLVLRLFGVVMIADNELGIVNKKFILFGEHKTLPDGSLIALQGEAGIQADTLAPGVHFLYWPWQYEITRTPFTKIETGRIGIVESRDGQSLGSGRVLAKHVECNAFQDARAFLANGGQRGPQISIVTPGTYRINTQLFAIKMESALEIEDNQVGIVTAQEGQPLPTGDIAGQEIKNHNMYQNGQAFMDNGGFKGLQEQVMLAGRYYVNPRFVTVETKPMTDVPIAHVGVVIAYVGAEGKDVTGDSFKHGNLVSKGQRGVWVTPLDPGKYPINPLTHKVENVPTANVVLNWADTKTEAHKLDQNLCTIKVRSSDGFTFNLDVSQIIHIPRNDAPKVIARFGSVTNLVTQVLEPTIGNYFRNAAQNSDVIKFLSQRTDRQNEAKSAIKNALEVYDVGAIDTLIGDITPPQDLMKTLTDRKLAEQQQITYGTQETAENSRAKLEQAKAMASTQARVVDAERKVTIAEFDARSAVEQAKGEANAKKIFAEGEAMKLTTVGEAQAKATQAVGGAEAEVIEKKTKAMDQGNYAQVEIARALASSGQRLVPDILVTGGNGANNSGLVDVLLGSILRDAMKKPGQTAPASASQAPATDVPAPQA